MVVSWLRHVPAVVQVVSPCSSLLSFLRVFHDEDVVRALVAGLLSLLLSFFAGPGFRHDIMVLALVSVLVSFFFFAFLSRAVLSYHEQGGLSISQK